MSRGSSGGCGGHIFIIDVPVLAAGPALKMMMPITIQSNLPHIVLQFGTNLDCPHSPSICCAVYSCAALSTGNFHYFASLAKRFPHCLMKSLLPRTMHQSFWQALSSPISTKLSSPSWRWASSFTSPTRLRRGRILLSWLQPVPRSLSTPFLACPLCRGRG